MASKSKYHLLCVDDEPHILEGLGLHLRRHYVLETATSGAAALEVLARDPLIAVVISDMRMPGMDGAAFLSRARQAAPNAVRMLLTGQADLDSAAAAINEGQIFRFLTKPLPPPALMAAVAAAVQQHELITAERVLLEQTLHGTIKALTDVLALVSPVSFGRATRIKQLVTELLDKLDARDRWQVEVAAMLSQIGFITLPAETAERVYHGRVLSPEEEKLVARVPATTEELLCNIPRLEGVREILKTYTKPLRSNPVVASDPQRQVLAQGAQLLRIAADFDALESSSRASPDLAIDALRGRAEHYDPAILEALAAIRGSDQRMAVCELPMNQLRAGMIFAEDVVMRTGVLLVARGHEITNRFLERVRAFPDNALRKGTWLVTEPSKDGQR